MKLKNLVSEYIQACVKYAVAEDDNALFYAALKLRGLMAHEAIHEFYYGTPSFDHGLHAYKPDGDVYNLLERISAEKRASLIDQP